MMKELPDGRFIVRLCGGLGNQMFQYAAGRAMSQRNQGELILDTRLLDRDPLRSFALDPLSIRASINLGEPSIALMLVNLTGMGIIGKRLGGRLRLGSTSLFWDREIGCDRRLLAVCHSAVLTGYWQSPAYFADAMELIRGDFTWPKPPEDGVQNWLEQIQKSTSVGVHVRRCDYAHDAKTHATHGLCEPAYYRKAAHRILDRFPDATFFVVSDDPDWTEQNLHLDAPMHVVRHPPFTDDSQDLRLLASCQHVITSNSSFSWWGAWLGAHTVGGMIVAPRTWFAGRPDLSDLIPSQWLRL